jgi:hypothetical protein
MHKKNNHSTSASALRAGKLLDFRPFSILAVGSPAPWCEHRTDLGAAGSAVAPHGFFSAEWWKALCRGSAEGAHRAVDMIMMRNLGGSAMQEEMISWVSTITEAATMAGGSVGVSKHTRRVSSARIWGTARCWGGGLSPWRGSDKVPWPLLWPRNFNSIVWTELKFAHRRPS